MQFRVMDYFIQRKLGESWIEVAKIIGPLGEADLLVAQANAYSKVEEAVDEFMGEWIKIQQPTSRHVRVKKE